MRIGALEFLRVGEQGEPWSPMRAWAISRPMAKNTDMDAWDLVTTPPPPGTPSIPLHDLKSWMLFDRKDVRHLTISGGGRDFTVTRRVPRHQAFVRYLGGILDSIPETHRAAEITLLIPAIDDESARKRYLDACREALPHARILPEPEMVVEYFRLVRRSLTLDKKRNNIILVVDIGASTSNATIVLSNRGSSVIGAETSRQRAGRLQAIQGSCGDVAGQWVDQWLAARLGIKLEDASVDERHLFLDSIEAAKIIVSRTGSPTPLVAAPHGGPYILRPQDMQDAAFEVVERLRPVLDNLAQRLWTQISHTEEALRRSEDVRKERDVKGPADALRLVDFVLLAGGTSRLAGVRELLESEFSARAPKFLDVGEDFPIAAAVGALAHVLHDKYNPPRLHAAERKEPPAEFLPLEGALDVDILLAVKNDPPLSGQLEQRRIVLERGDPVIYTGGRRDAVLALDGPAEAKFMARLLPGGDEKQLRKGLSPRAISLKHASPSIGFVVDSDRRMVLNSTGVRQIRSIRLDLERLGKVEALSARPYQGEIPSGALAIDHADEVVIDFGMSKTVVVAAQSGLLDPSMLATLNATRAQVPAPSAEHVSIPAAIPDVEPVVDLAPSAATTDDASEPAVKPGPGLATVPDEVTPAELTVTTSETPLDQPEAGQRESTGADETAVPPTVVEDLIRGTDGFIEALQVFLTAAEEQGLDVPGADLLFTLLGLSVRPLVLLAGAPGCGKSTLARIVAHLLRRSPGVTFHDVPVQSHWSNDDPLFENGGLLHVLREDLQRTHLVLFDEINLTRPEYYLARYFHAVERPGSLNPTGLRLAATLTLGTLNIDDTSRAPSPKVLDRCFLVEMDQVAFDHQPRLDGELRLGGLPTLPSLPRPAEHRSRVEDSFLSLLLAHLDSCVRSSGLREDLLPSRRVLGDISAVIELHGRLGDGASSILPRPELIDRLIASRILIKLSGPVEQVEPALLAVETLFRTHQDLSLPRSRRRLGLARKQAKLGFVFPWQ